MTTGRFRIYFYIEFMKFLSLPYQFKKLGWIIILLCIPFLLVCRYLKMEREFSMDLASIFALIGLIIALLSKEKNQTEDIEKLKSRCLGYAFISIIVFVIMNTIFDLVGFYSANHDSHLSSPIGLIYMSTIMYYVNFWTFKTILK